LSDDFLERLRIREVIEAWVLWRDTGDWPRFRTVWHSDGMMNSTHFQGPVEEFIERVQKSWNSGALVLHQLGGTAIEVAGTRAVAQTKMNISTRDHLDGVLCDIVCTGRFYDFFEKRDGRWAIVLRQPIYEKDRLDPVDPAARVTLDPELLAQFPDGYRHLAYGQAKRGFAVRRNMPGFAGPEVERLYARGAAWLAGRPLERE
jgi:hypothetical protein